jgi:hypothetical protein
MGIGSYSGCELCAHRSVLLLITLREDILVIRIKLEGAEPKPSLVRPASRIRFPDEVFTASDHCIGSDSCSTTW